MFLSLFLYTLAAAVTANLSSSTPPFSLSLSSPPHQAWPRSSSETRLGLSDEAPRHSWVQGATMPDEWPDPGDRLSNRPTSNALNLGSGSCPDPILFFHSHRNLWNMPASSVIRLLGALKSEWISGVVAFSELEKQTAELGGRGRIRICFGILGFNGQRCNVVPALLRKTYSDPWGFLAPAIWVWCSLVPVLIVLSPSDPRYYWGSCLWIPLMFGLVSCRTHSLMQTQEWLWYRDGFDIAHEDKSLKKEGTVNCTLDRE